MSKVIKIMVFVLAAAILLGTSIETVFAAPSPENASKRLSIMTTIFPVYDFARAVVGDRADVSMLVRPGSEVHSFDPSPQDILSIRNADVFIYIGGKSETWVETLVIAAEFPGRAIRLIEHVEAVREGGVEHAHTCHEHGHEHAHGHGHGHGHTHEHGHAHSHGHGHTHGQEHAHAHECGHTHRHEEYDEHIWTSPTNAIAMIRAIMDGLRAVDPSNSYEYIVRAYSYIGEIEALREEFKAIVASAERKKIVIGDRFPFRYFTDEFGLEYRAAFPGCHTQSDISAATMAYLIRTVTNYGIPVVYMLELSSGNIARAIAGETGAEVLTLHSCHNVTREEFESGVTYVSLMRQNLENLRKGLN
jgi:zinc transport system substrate-binding protein